MKILIVDYLCQKGHKNYVRILIDAIASLNFDVSFITSHDYMDYLQIDNKRINKITYQTKSFKVRSRLDTILHQIYSLKLIEKKICRKNFNYIIFASYNIFSYVFFKRKEVTYIINHDNIDRMSHGYSKLFHKYVGKNSIYVVLSLYIKSYLNKIISKEKIVYVPHGVPYGVIQPLLNNSDSTFSKYPNIIFCSARSSCNVNFLNELLLNECNQRFLEHNDIFLIVRTNRKFETNCKNIVYIDSDQRIAELDYDYIITHAMCVYLPYLEDFKYRVSGIFYECILNNIPVLFNKTESALQYAEYVAYDYEITKPEEFKDRISLFLGNKNKLYYKNLDKLDQRVYWKKILL